MLDYLRKLAMSVIAPVLGLDRWEAVDNGLRRYDVAEAKWQFCGMPPDGCRDLDVWLSSLHAPSDVE